MPWRSRNSFVPSDKLHSDDLNNLANDDRTWGGDVNGGGYTLSNVNIVALNPLAAGAVFSVFARTGDVIAQAGDYTAAQVGAVPTARQIITGPSSGLSGGGPLSTDLTLLAAVKTVFGRTGDISLTSTDISNAGGVVNTRQIKTLAGSGLTGGGSLAADLSLSVVPDSSNQQIQVMSQGSPIGSPRPKINFISGTGALITVSEISVSNRIDVTVASTGTGGGMVDPTQVVGDLIVRGLTAPATRMPVGTDGQVLTADHLQALGVKWATPSNTGQVTSVFTRTGAVVQVTGDYTAAQITNAVDQTGSYTNPPWIVSLPWTKVSNPPAFMLDPTVAKGDLIVHGATTTRLPAGADGSILTADSSLPAGVKWGSLAVASVFSRAGVVVAQAGDYTVAQVTGAVPNTLTINTGTGLQGGGNLSSNRTLAVVPDTTNQQLQVLLAGAVVGTRHAINFVNGANVALSISDNAGANQIDLTVSSTGGAGGMVDPTTGIGDLIVRGATAVQRLGVGLNGQVLTSDNTQALGLRWAAVTGGGAGSQSPWIGNVDAAAFNLNNVGGIGVNVASNKTVARVYALTNASEDGFRTVNNTAAGMAAASFINDLGDSICIRSYGSGFVGGLPGLATLEASKPLALLANAAEVMRLTAGRVLIGTTTDDATNLLQVNGKVKSKTGGFVFPDNTIQTTAFTTASSAVTSVYTRTGAVVAVAGDYTAALVTNAVDSSSTYANPSWISSLAWSKITGAPALLVDPTTTKGDIIARGTAAPATRLPASTTDNWVLTADSTAALGVKWAAVPAAPQTPWASDIDAAGFKLKNAGRVSIGNDGTALPDGSPTDLRLIVGSTAVSGPAAQVNLIGNSATDATLAQINAANYNLGTTEKRVATLNMLSLGAPNTGAMDFYTWNAGSPVLAMRIKPTGVGIGTASPLNVFQVRGAANQNLGIRYDGTAMGIGTFNDAGSVGVPMDFNATAYYFLTGNVGIGTTSPQSVLQISSPAGSPSVTYHAPCALSLDVVGGIELAFGAINANPWPAWIQSRGSGNAANNLLINPLGGNVGIGTTSPNKLGASTPHTITMQTRSMLVVGDTTQNGTDDGLIQVGSFGFVSSNNWTGIAMLSRNLAAKSVGNTDTYYTPVASGIGYSACVLDGGGNFQFASLGYTATAGQAVSPNVLMTILRTGSVGIGTTSPTTTLELAEPGQPKLGFFCTTGNANQQRGALIYDGGANLTGGGWTFQRRTDAGGFAANLVNIIASNGRVGIMTTTPAYQLDVVGGINATGNYSWNGAAMGTFATRNDVTGSRAVNQTYGNPYGRPMLVNVTASVNSSQYMQLLTDGGNPPTTIAAVMTNTNTTGTSGTYTVSAFVMPGHYFQIFLSSGSLTKWIEWA